MNNNNKKYSKFEMYTSNITYTHTHTCLCSCISTLHLRTSQHAFEQRSKQTYKTKQKIT